MRISDWSSDVCSSDLLSPAGIRSMRMGEVSPLFLIRAPLSRLHCAKSRHGEAARRRPVSRLRSIREDRKSVVQGKRESVRDGLGRRRNHKKKYRSYHIPLSLYLEIKSTQNKR